MLLKVSRVDVAAQYWNICLLRSTIYFKKRHVQIRHVLMAVHVLFLTVVISVPVCMDLQVHDVKVWLHLYVTCYYLITNPDNQPFLWLVYIFNINNNYHYYWKYTQAHTQVIEKGWLSGLVIRYDIEV